MKTVSKLGTTAGLVCLAVYGSSAMADGDDGLVVVPKLGFSYKNVGLDPGSGKSFNSNLVTLDIGATLAYRSFYLSAGYDTSIKDSIEHNTTPSGSGTPDDSIIAISRDDAALTLGYNAWKGLSVFAGYKYGRFDAVIISDVTVMPPGNGAIRFTTHGPFLGAGYSFRLSKGSLDFSVAYAAMSGELKSSRAAGTVTVEGDATGFSYGISWSGALSETATYTVGLKANRYSFDADPPPGTTDEPDLDEVHNIFHVAIQKYF